MLRVSRPPLLLLAIMMVLGARWHGGCDGGAAMMNGVAMYQHQCQRCGADGTVRLASQDGWTCGACATALSQARLFARRRAREAAAAREVAHGTLRRAEFHALSHLRMG